MAVLEVPNRCYQVRLVRRVPLADIILQGCQTFCDSLLCFPFGGHFFDKGLDARSDVVSFGDHGGHLVGQRVQSL